MVEKYAKIIDETLKTCIVGLGTDDDFYSNLGMHLMEVEQGDNGCWYVAGYAPPTQENE